MACRKELRKQYTRYTTKSLELRGRCLGDVGRGSINGPCPDSRTASRLAALVATIDPTRLASKCPSSVVPTIGAALGCASAVDAGDLTACLLAADDAATDRMLDVQYADSSPVTAIADGAQRGCQEAITKAMGSYVKSALSSISKCESTLDLGKTDVCPDASTSAALHKAETKAFGTIAAACSDAEIQGLDAAGTFGGPCAGAASVATLQQCERDENLASIADVTGIIEVHNMMTTVTFTVPVGVSRLVLALNGREKNGNDLDIYARLGTDPTTSVFDASSENDGMFEEITITAPAAGVWHVLIDRYSGDLAIPFQLNATVFKP